jgi:hypothetical protein
MALGPFIKFTQHASHLLSQQTNFCVILLSPS